MILRIYFVLIIYLQEKVISEKSCKRIKIKDKWYKNDIVWSDIRRPYNLILHKSSNTLFFVYTTSGAYSSTQFQIGSYNFDVKEDIIINDVRGGCAIATDQDNGDIYFGGSDGIYKYNATSKRTDFYKESGVDIWSLFYNRNLFYISYPDQRLHIEVDGKFKIVTEFADTEIEQFYVSEDNIIYFSNRTGLYRYNYIVVETVSEVMSIRQITENRNGDIYICTHLGLYTYDQKGLTKILDMKNIYGVTFDKDNNLVISDEKSVMKLELAENDCTEENMHLTNYTHLGNN